MFITRQEQKRLDPRIKRTRKLLNQAFMELMNEKGFQSITVQDIADRAEVNRATFYAHYEGKVDLLESFVREGFLEWLGRYEPVPGGVGIESLAQLVGAIIEFTAQMDEHCGKMDKQLEPMLLIAVQDELKKHLLGWFKRIPAEDSPLGQPLETVAMLWSWAILGSSMQWSRTTRTPGAREMAVQVAEALTSPLGQAAV